MRRNKKYLGSPFQKKFIFKMVITFLLMLLLFSLFFFFLSYHLAKQSSSSTGSLSAQILKLGVFVFQLKILAVIFILLLIIIYLAIRFSHKIAGPIYNIEQKLDEIVKGDLTTNIFLRGDDEIQELANKINYIINDFRDVIEAARDEIQEIKNFIAQKGDSLEDDLRKSLEEKILKLEKVVSKYKILND